MRHLVPSRYFAATAAALVTAAVLVGCARPRAASVTTASPSPATATAPTSASKPAPATVAVTRVSHGHHEGTRMANGTVTFGDYFIQTPTNMNGVHAGAEGLACQSLRVPKLLQVIIHKRSDAGAPVPKLLFERSAADPPNSLVVPAGTALSQVKIGDFAFYRGLWTEKEHHLQVIVLIAADEDNDIFIRAAAADPDEFANLLECIATFRYAAP